MPQKFNIDGKEYEVEGAKNVLDGCLKAGVEVPHYCWHPALSVVASCRLCLVETGAPDPKDPSKVVWAPKLNPSCQTPVVRDGTTYVKTKTDKVVSNQKHVMEYLLINHPLDCPVCDQAGECLLQDFSFKYGNSVSRFVENKEKQPKKDVGTSIVLFADRCIMCSRCVRFEQEISGGERLGINNRGNHCEIDIFPGRPLDHKMSGNVGDVCPVGALEDKDFLYKQRVWFLKDFPSVCNRCSVGCSTWADANPTTNVLWRVRPRINPQVNTYWMCDDGRYGWKYVHAPNRLLKPALKGEAAKAVAAAGSSAAIASATSSAAVASSAPAREAALVGAGAGSGPTRGGGATAATIATLPIATVNGVPASRSGTGVGGVAHFDPGLAGNRKPAGPSVDWSAVLHAVADGFNKVVRKHGESTVVGVISPFASNEETHLAAAWLRKLGGNVRLALGPVPTVGEPVSFKKGFPGDKPFTILPEKAPNRKGVEAVLAHHSGGSVTGFDAVVADLRAGKVKGMFVLGGYPETAPLDAVADDLRKAEFLVVLEYLAGKATEAADVTLAGATHYERDGSWVNYAGVLQRFEWAFPPVGETRRDGQIFADLLGRRGLYNSADVLAELASSVPAFAEARGGQLPPEGVKLSALAAAPAQATTTQAVQAGAEVKA